MNAIVQTPGAERSQDLQAAAKALGMAGGAGASRLLALLYDPDVAIDRVLACLNGEPALAARVLKVANSPYYRLSGSVGTVERAVQLLGLSAIRGIAAAGCLDRLAPPRLGPSYDPEIFRRHSLAVAAAAQQFSRAAGAGVDAEAFMAGLLHDIGVLMLVKLDPVAMGRWAPCSELDAATERAAEQAHFGCTHEGAALVLVQAWSLPVWLANALAHHHGEPPEGPVTDLAALPSLLRLADHAASRAEFNLWPICAQPPHADTLAALGLSNSDVDEVVAGLPAHMLALAQAL
jgi:HD-like signal output (HDOD) protein